MFLLQDFIKNKYLILELFKRDLYASFKGTFFGIAWTLINSLFLLTIYTFLFSFVFKTKWGGTIDGSIADFSIMLFAGLSIYTFFIEILARSPSLILANVNFVKKLVFPLHILAYVVTSRALFNFFVSFFVLILGQIIVSGHFHLSTFLAPFILVPLVFYSLGVVWLVSAISVYVRDIAYFVQTLTTVIMFISPIFYPVTALPEKVRFLIYLNPLTTFIEQFRQVVVHGGNVQGYGIWIHWVLSLCFMYIGYLVFSKLRKGFADVL